MITRLFDSLSQQIHQIRKERWEPLLTSKNPRARKIAQEGFDNPSNYEIFITLIRLFVRQIKKGVLFFFSPLIDLKNKNRYQSLIGLVSGNNIIEKKKAIQSLTEFPGPETNKLLIQLLSDDSFSIRETSVETIWNMQITEAIEPLFGLYNNETDCFLRIMTSLCLISMGDTRTFQNLFDDIAENSIHNDQWDMTDLVTSSLLPKLGKGSIPFLENGLKHSDWHVRWIALRTIFDITSPEYRLKQYSYLGNDPSSEIQELYAELCC